MRSVRVAAAALLAFAAGACSDSNLATGPDAATAAGTVAPVAPSFSLVGGTGTASALKPRLASDMCLDVPASQYVNGKLLETWSCHGGVNQQFIWKSTGEIVPSGNQTFCLDAYGGSGNAGDPIGLWGCHGGPNQKWTASAAGEIKGINGRCIGLSPAVRANGTKLTLQDCNGSVGQLWDNAASGAAPAPAPPAAPAPAPAPTPAPSPIPSNAIPVFPGQSIQAAVNANPAGTNFVLKAGTHTGQSVIPKSGDGFYGETGTVLDGQGASYAFSKGNAPYPSNVTIRGLKVTNYTPAMQYGTIDAGGYGVSQGTTGWVIDNNEVSYNGEYGIRIGNSTRVTNNNVHHNKRLNLAGSGTNTVIEGNEVAYGNYLNLYDANFEAGGTKFSYTDGLVLRNNYLHDNLSSAIHMDENNINTLIENNRIENNASEGVEIEISYATIIRNNTITGNGWKDPRNRYSYLWNAGIGVHASPNVEIYGNTLSGNYAGIAAIQQNRDMDKALYGPHIVQNLYVHDNVITQSSLPRNSNELSVAAGAVQDVGDLSIFNSRNNRWVNNKYNLGSNPRPFAWQNGTRTESDWKGYGQDVTGVFNR